MQIRPAKPTDVLAIEAFEVFDHDVLSAIQREECLVAEEDARAVGYLVYARRGLFARDFVKFLVVDPAYRRQGIAAALLSEVENAIGMGRLYISTESDNDPMQALLHRQKWIPAGGIEGVNVSGNAELFYYKDLPC